MNSHPIDSMTIYGAPLSVIERAVAKQAYELGAAEQRVKDAEERLKSLPVTPNMDDAQNWIRT